MAMSVDKREEVRKSSSCYNSALLGCSHEESMAMLVDKQEEVRDSSVCENSGLQRTDRKG